MLTQEFSSYLKSTKISKKVLSKKRAKEDKTEDDSTGCLKIYGNIMKKKSGIGINARKSFLSTEGCEYVKSYIDSKAASNN